MSRAKPGDKIVVRGPAVEEEWTKVEATFPKNVTIEVVPPGQHPTWRLPKTSTALTAVLTVANMNGVRFKSFAFDGDGRAENGIYLTSNCAGVSFEDCRVLNFTQAGVKISNASGEGGRPIAFVGLRVTGNPTAKAGFHLFAATITTNIKANQHVHIRECVIDGPFPAHILIEGSAAHLEFADNRLIQATDGVVVRRLNKDTQWSSVRIHFNTIHKIDHCLVARRNTGFDWQRKSIRREQPVHPRARRWDSRASRGQPVDHKTTFPIPFASSATWTSAGIRSLKCVT